MNGSRLVSDIGVPSTVSIRSVGDTNSTASPSLTTAPVPLPKGSKYAFAIAQGSRIILGNETASEIIASFPNEKPIIQLLTDKEAIYVIHSDGNIHAIDQSGKLLWQFRTSGFDEADPHSILTENALVTESDTGIIAIDLHSGKKIWSHQTLFPPHNLIYDNRSKVIITSLSFDGDTFGLGDSLHHHATDSVLCLTTAGVVKSRFGIPGDRIISNLCICGKGNNLVAFGYLHQPGGGDLRTIHAAVFSGIESGNPKKISDHELPYLPTQIASNGLMVFTGGFYGTGSSLESGIDAFAADDTMKLWQRRFTYPVVLPFAVSKTYLYFSLTFSAEAIAPAQSIFYTLDVTTGKTLGELPVTGAQSGFAIGIPMPIGESGFILADRNRSAIYFLKP